MKILILAFALSSLAIAQNAPVWPGRLATNQDLLIGSNNFSATLSNNLAATDTIIFVNSVTGIVTPTTVSIGTEIIKVCSSASSPPSLNVCTNGRGFDGTTARAAPRMSVVQALNNAWYHNQLAAEVIALESTLGTTGIPLSTNGLAISTGSNAPSSDDSSVLVHRAASNPISNGGSHAFRDESVYNAGGVAGGYSSYDSIYQFVGGVANNHARSYQSRIQYSSAASIIEIAGVYAQPTHTGTGVVGSVLGLRMADALGTGPINLQVGLYCDSLTRATANYCVYENGIAPNYFGGNILTAGTYYSGALGSPAALVGSTGGIMRTAIATDVGSTVTVGNANIFISPQGAPSNTGSNNVGIGSLALNPNTSGANNVAIGPNSLGSTTIGSNNTAVGVSSGFQNITGSSNTFIGFQAFESADGLTDSTALGAGSVVSTSHTVELGSSTVNRVQIGNQCSIYKGSGSPNSTQVGSPCDLYLNTAGGAGATLWVKESGAATNTGWVAK